MQLVLDTQGLTLQKHSRSFMVGNKHTSRRISPLRITSIAIMQQCIIHSSAVLLAAEHGIPVLFFSRTGRAKARLWSPYFGNIATIRRRQAMYALTPEATEWVISLFALKLEGQCANLRLLADQVPQQAQGLHQTIDAMNTDARALEQYRLELLPDCGNNIIGTEGTMARRYWQALSAALPEQYRFEKRSRQPAQDRFNATINYLYGMLYGTIEGACLATGLDPYLGFLHTDRHRKPTFTFDLIEPFRPWVDELVIRWCMEEKLLAEYFRLSEKSGIVIHKSGKQFIIPAFNEMMQQKRVFEGKTTTARHHIHHFAGEFAQFLLKNE